MESRWSLCNAVTPFKVMHPIAQTRRHGYRTCSALFQGWVDDLAKVIYCDYAWTCEAAVTCRELEFNTHG